MMDLHVRGCPASCRSTSDPGAAGSRYTPSARCRGPPEGRSSLATRTCPHAGSSIARSTTAVSTSGATRFFGIGLRREISASPASPPVSYHSLNRYVRPDSRCPADRLAQKIMRRQISRSGCAFECDPIALSLQGLDSAMPDAFRVSPVKIISAQFVIGSPSRQDMVRRDQHAVSDRDDGFLMDALHHDA